MEPRPPPKIPKDGPGPRGLPDCYYTSRVLNSTFRYVKFVKKLRATEEEQRKGQLNTLKELKDKQTSDFFIRCDRRSLINNVKRRVDLCLASYEDDLQRKRNRLLDLFKKEEERDIRMFVEQAQAGREAIWQDKVDRLQYLLQKRKKEHEEKYKDTLLTKSPHVTACIHKLRAKEAQEIQLYQMKEKQARRESEHEFDKMWHEVAMRESDALAARMEQDAIDRYRRDLECKQYTDMQLEERRQQRERDREILKQEQLLMKQRYDEDSRKEAEAERLRVEKRHETARERKEMIEERKQTLAKQEAQDQLIKDTWDSLAGQGLSEEKAKLALRRRKEMELDVCNKKMIALREQLKSIEVEDEVLVHQEAKRLQDVTDKKRCDYLIWSQKTNADVRKAMVDQIKEHQAAREQLKKKLDEQDEYYRQLQAQLQALVDHRALEDLRARKTHQQNLLDQMEYNKLLKDRAKQEELEQIKKCELATEEYQQEVNRMLCRPFFSDELHPFMKQMAKGLNMREKCPCSKPDYCK